ncbi:MULTISPECIES: glycosyltransferase family 9 protein [Niastella]|uniref:Glycosyltransferase family 9 protein n=1 Tax=Niastella soli TaxID=2821487 RepID=A0ABS3YUV5_9BACT|nr:glycosyltransferase family 9 protein [Niastella soli]MBO9201609.1 glycosyltransferase family 9 protein [Niastella soli]
MIQFNEEQPKIALFRALQLGDMLCAVPALRALRHAFPKAEITLIGLPWAHSFVDRFNKYVDRLIVFPGYPGLPEQSFSQPEWDEFITRMQKEEFDCILQMQGNGTIVNEMLQQLQPKQLAGFHRYDSRMNEETFVEYPERENEINRHLLLMQHLGIPGFGTQLEFPVSEQEEIGLLQIAPFVHQEKYVIVHPGSRDTSWQWPPLYFAALADFCASHGYRVVLTGTTDETYITDYLADLMQQPVTNLAGKTSLGMVAALIEHAQLLIANCTGVSQIAAATKTPSLIISMDGEPHRWGPLNRQLHHVYDWTRKRSFTDVYHKLVEMLSLKERSVHALSRFGPVQLGERGFIIG